jgi:hypothetical protein
MASSSHLKPGEKGKITAKIDMMGRKGALYKTIQVFSNDPKRPSAVLSLRATIQ